MSVSFGAQTGLVLADARPQAGRCFLPLSASLLGRTVTIKDQFGAATASSIQIITNAPDTFEDGTSSRWINNDYGFMTIAATASNVWTVIGGTKQPTFQASTISTFLLATQTLSSVTAGISLAAVSSLSAATAYMGSGYISTLSTVNLAAPSPYFSTVRYFDTGTGIYTSMSLSSSYIYLNGAAAPIVVPWQQVSTVAGLGTTGYVSTLSLTSSIAGLGTAGYVSTSWFHSTIAGLGTLGYISTTEDTVRTTSTVTGLGTVGYVSSQQGLITTSSVQVSSIAASMRGVQFLLAGSGSLLSTGIFYSQDGTTGSNATLVPNIINYYDAAVASNGFLQNTGGTEYVLAADLPNRLYVSSNLTSWLPVVSTPTATAKSIAFGSNAGVGTYIATTAAAGAASIQYRRNIDTGFMPIITAGGFSVAGSRAAYNPATDRWVAAGVDATASTLQYTTTLTTWTASAGPTFSTVANSVIWAPGFSRFYAVGKAAVSTATIKMSADGITWSNANTGGFANCNIGALDIAYGNVGGTVPTLVAVGEGAPGGSISTIQWSTDGLNFSNATAGNFVSTNFAAGTAVAYSATLGQWMAAGGASSILTSADGKAWTNAAFQRPVGFTANRIFAPNTPFYTTLPIIAGPEALFQAGRQIVDTGYLNTFLATKSFGTSTFSTLTVAQNGTMAALLLNSNGSAAPTNYGAGVDTLTVQTTNAGYTGGIASMAFATATAAYPLARIYAVDSASSGPANSQLVFQTVPLSASSFSSNVSYTGANQTFTVPAGVTTISVAMWGAGGGGGSASGRGGAGAFIQGTLTVTPGQVLTLIVGQSGLYGQSLTGYGGGAAPIYGSSGGGGGRSAIQTQIAVTISTASGSGTTVTYTTSSAHGLLPGQPVVIAGLTPSGYNGTFAIATTTSSQFTVTSTTTGASSGTGTITIELVDVGGGGGAGQETTQSGGAAAYSGTASAGTPGTTGGVSTWAGQGGTQTGGGAGGISSGSPGTILAGGGGATGGGAGYYGGGGGSRPGSSGGFPGGGGGSSYTTNSAFTLLSGSNSTDGFSAPATGYSGYQTGIAVGGAQYSSGGAGLILLASIGNAYAEAMRIGTTGNVGIGTTAPAALLDVAGTSRAQALSSLTVNASTFTLNTGKLSTLNVVGSLNMSNTPISNIANTSFSPIYSGNPNQGAGGTYSSYVSSGIVMAAHIFSKVGTTMFTPTQTITGAMLLVIGGGGSGGTGCGGGGGAGGAVYQTGLTITSSGGPYSIIVGAGGIASVAFNAGNNGGNSSAFTYSGTGGGGGGTGIAGAATTGGCGGGGGYATASASGTQGYGGGTGGTNVYLYGGGGGGMGSAGSNYNSVVPAAGGAGVIYSIVGSNVGYTAGGAGAINNGSTLVVGGSANGSVIGGYGGSQSVTGGTAGVENTGSGGGAGCGSGLSGAGGSGIVILAYPTAQYGSYTVNVGSITGDANSNLSLQATYKLSITGNTQIAGALQTSTSATSMQTLSTLAINDYTTPSTGSLYQISSVLYYNNTAIGGVTAANIQAFTF